MISRVMKRGNFFVSLSCWHAICAFDSTFNNVGLNYSKRNDATVLCFCRDEKKQFHENLKSISETLHASTMGKNNFSGTYKSSYQQSTIAPRKMVLSSSRPTSAYEYFQNSNVQQNETNDNIIDNADQVPSHFDHEHINK